MEKVNEGDIEKIRNKLTKSLGKCVDNFNNKMGDDKKLDEKIQEIKMIVTLSNSGYPSTTLSATSSIDNFKNNKTLSKTPSQASSKVSVATNPKKLSNIPAPNQQQ